MAASTPSKSSLSVTRRASRTAHRLRSRGEQPDSLTLFHDSFVMFPPMFLPSEIRRHRENGNVNFTCETLMGELPKMMGNYFSDHGHSKSRCLASLSLINVLNMLSSCFDQSFLRACQVPNSLHRLHSETSKNCSEGSAG